MPSTTIIYSPFTGLYPVHIDGERRGHIYRSVSRGWTYQPHDVRPLTSESLTAIAERVAELNAEENPVVCSNCGGDPLTSPPCMNN